MSEQQPAARTFASKPRPGCLARILTAAILVGGLGARLVLAQDASQLRPAAPEAMSPATSLPPSASPAATTALSPAGEPVAPQVPEATPVPSQQAAATPGEIPSPGATAKKAHDLTPMGMFLAAGPVVQAVMIVLAAASSVTWIILLARGGGLLFAKRRISAANGALRKAGGLADASERITRGVAGRLLLTANEEVLKSQGLPSEGIKERTLMALQRVEAGAARRMASGTGILATIGSIGPFVGLLGTVWGIMSSFIGIAESNTTSLAVVAPGIAEALLATGIGLAAAIPAVVIYNALARSITGYRALLADAVALTMIHLSRDLDRGEAIGSATGSSLRLAAE